MAFDESLAARIRDGLADRKGVEDDEQLTDWIERATRFARTLPAKEK